MEQGRPLQCGASGQVSFRQSSSDVFGLAAETPSRVNHDTSYAVPDDSTPRSTGKSELFASTKDDAASRHSIIQQQIRKRAGAPHPTSRTANHYNDRENNPSSLMSGRHSDASKCSLRDVRDGYTPVKSQQGPLKAEFHLHKASMKKGQPASQYTTANDFYNDEAAAKGTQKADPAVDGEDPWGQRVSGELRRSQAHQRAVQEAMLYDQLAGALFGHSYEGDQGARGYVLAANAISPSHRATADCLRDAAGATAADAYALASSSPNLPQKSSFDHGQPPLFLQQPALALQQSAPYSLAEVRRLF